MEVSNRIRGKKINEMIVLNTLYLVFTLIYLVVQLLFTRRIDDYVFVLMLSFGTFFLNIRQKMLFERLWDDDIALEYYKVHNIDDYKNNINQIFNNHIIDIMAIIWGCFFGYVVSFILMPENNSMIKISFAIFLACANIPTALAFYRLYKLYKFYIKLIDKMTYNYYDINNSDVSFVVSLRDFVLFTVVAYVAVCLSSVLFTKINLGALYKIYTGLAIVLIIVIFAYSNYYIYKKKNDEVEKIKNVLDNKINLEYKKVCESEDYYKIEKIETYKKYKSLLNENKLDISKVTDIIKLIGMTALPLLLQWFLNKN